MSSSVVCQDLVRTNRKTRQYHFRPLPLFIRIKSLKPIESPPSKACKAEAYHIDPKRETTKERSDQRMPTCQ